MKNRATLGIDIVGPSKKTRAREFKYIMADMDYLSKWNEAIAVRDFEMLIVSDFIPIQIFGIIVSLAGLRHYTNYTSSI